MAINSFHYNQVCPVRFGEGVAGEAGEKMRELGCRKVLLVCDQNGVRFGLVDRVKSGFEGTGVQLLIFDEATPDPEDVMVDRCAAIARREDVDGLVGVGGGSVMDTAKTVGVLLRNQGSVREHMKPNVPPNPAAPVILIPSTAGTGSEVTDVGVITHTGLGQKIGVVSNVSLALVDPTLTYSAPPSVTAETAMDALAHAAECMTCTLANPHADALAIQAIERITRFLPLAVADGAHAEARRELALASNLAGIAFNETLVHIGHAMAQGMGAKLHLSHGATCALALPSALKYAAPAVPGQLAKVARAMGLEVAGQASAAALGQQVADHLHGFMKGIGLASLKERGFGLEEVVACTDTAMKDFLVEYCPVPVTEDRVREMYREIYEFGAE